MGEPDVAADRRTMADHDAAEDRRARVDHDIVLQGRVSLAARLRPRLAVEALLEGVRTRLAPGAGADESFGEVP